MRAGPVVDIRYGMDLANTEVLLWILFLVRALRVWLLIWEPPCTSASVARRPALRTIGQADGLSPSENVTATGNLHLYQCMALVYLHTLMGGASVGEQPAAGYFRHLPVWAALVHMGAKEVVFDWCRYGRAWKKPTRLLAANFPGIEDMGLRCVCPPTMQHEILKGRATQKAA